MKSLFLAVVCLFATFALVSCDDYGDNLYCSDKPCELARCECLEVSQISVKLHYNISINIERVILNFRSHLENP